LPKVHPGNGAINHEKEERLKKADGKLFIY